jgi:hypothetical protein
MTDRELLELAAKAVGLSLEQGPGSPPEKCFGACWDGHTWDYWNPLDDDGDALRLAVKLDFRIDIDKERAWTAVYANRSYNIDTVLEANDNNDPYAATRRAIVRAAAEIGRAM